MENTQFPNLRAALESYSGAVAEMYQQRLISSDRVASRFLLDNVTWQIREGDAEWQVVLRLADYWKYVENGTRPHWPPRAAILSWIRAKRLVPKPDKRGKLPTEQQLSFLIARKISREGTKGSRDIGKTLDALNAVYRKTIVAAVMKDLDAGIRAVLFR